MSIELSKEKVVNLITDKARLEKIVKTIPKATEITFTSGEEKISLPISLFMKIEFAEVLRKEIKTIEEILN
jgi:hypothetical protein